LDNMNAASDGGTITKSRLHTAAPANTDDSDVEKRKLKINAM